MFKNKRPKFAQPPRPAKLDSGVRYIRISIRGFLADWKLYTLVVLIVAVPIDLLSLSASLSSDSQFSSFTQLAALIMNLALLWAIIRRTDGHKVTLAQAYYDGTASILRFILVSAALVVMLIPVGFAVLLYTLSLNSVYALSAWSPEQLLVGFVCLLIASVSFFLIVRFSLSVVAVVNDQLRPVAALRRSWRLTRRRYWAVAGRLALLLLFLIILAIPPSLIAAALVLVHVVGPGVFLFQLLATLLALPIANLYLVQMFRNLVQTMPHESPTSGTSS